MSNVVKWGLLAAAVVALIALIMALPIVGFVDVDEFGSLLGQLATLAGGVFKSARGIINNFLTPFGRTLLTGIIAYLFGRWAITLGIKIVSWVYHFVFRG